MSEDRHKSHEAEVPAEADETTAQEEPQFRKISEEELEEILVLHQKWVNSDGKKGKRADLRKTNLKGREINAFLDEADLREANLRVANLCESNLFKADLRGADLKGANLSGVSLIDADFRGADLKGAKLEGIEQYSGIKLGGANLDGVKLPLDLHEFEGLKTLEEASRNARKIFQVMLLACAYSLLTIFSTKDPALLTNSSSSPLPIIQTGVPIAGFFVVAPIILFAAYLYFHIYLQRLWEGLADLPAIFPDGRPLDKRAYPWLLNGLVRSHFKLLQSERPPLSRLQAFVSILLAWCTVPAMLFLFWGRYLPRHHWLGTVPNIALLAASIGFGIYSYRLTRRTLRGEEWGKIPHWKQAWKDVRIYSGAAALGSVVIFFVISFAAISGVGLSMVADFRDAEVSIKPQNWTGQKDKEKEEIALVKGAQLKGADLRRANAHRAFLVNADLRGAKLQNANLVFADLRGADLSGAKLQGAALLGTNLQGANLVFADLRGANLFGAKLQGANLRRVEKITVFQLKTAEYWDLAFYDDEFLKRYGEELGLPQSEEEHTENVKKKLAELEKASGK